MARKPSRRVTEVVVLGTAMLTFISPWHAAAVVLCDMASTAWYIGGIVEHAVGEVAPWLIIGVMLFSSCMLCVYVEASSLFVRGGVYRVVKESMGSTLAKLAVSALMFDYVLTGAINSVAAGQYLGGLVNSALPQLGLAWQVPARPFAVVCAVLIVLFFWRQNILGIHESSGKSLKIIKLVSVMGLVIFLWSGLTIYLRGFDWPTLDLSLNAHALGWLGGGDWHLKVAALGLLIAFGHAFLGMSGLETLAQVYREMEAPKLPNLKKAAVAVFMSAILLTGTISLLAVGIIPDEVRGQYLDNLLSGLAMSMVGPDPLKLMFQAFVVAVGAMILSGAVNASVIGLNGELNRMAEDGVMPEWFRSPHRRFGTTHRMISLVVAMQLLTIILCGGNVYLLGEAYAFGLVWSFFFIAVAVAVLRFTSRGDRVWMVPLNVPMKDLQFPIGLLLVILVLFAVAVINLLTKQTATIAGGVFTAVFFAIFFFTERASRRAGQEHRERLLERRVPDLASLQGGLGQGRETTLVAVGGAARLQHLNKVLEELDVETADAVVMYSKIERGVSFGSDDVSVGPEESRIFTKVVSMAEKHGKSVSPLLVVSNDPAYAVAQAAQAVRAAEVVVGTSQKISIEMQLERLAMTWGALQRPDQGAVRLRIIGKGGVETTVDL